MQYAMYKLVLSCLELLLKFSVLKELVDFLNIFVIKYWIYIIVIENLHLQLIFKRLLTLKI